MMKSFFQKRNLVFKTPAATSRGKLHHKPSWFVFLYDEDNPGIKGIGECSIIPGLSIDNEITIEEKLYEVCSLINKGEHDFLKPIHKYPSITFGLETALLDYKASGTKVLFPSAFTKGLKGIPINGLIWMGNPESMYEQVEKKLKEGFRCIKIKIGAINFNDEVLILHKLRKRFSAQELELRVDANGAFSPDEAPAILERLAELEVHSIEQPILPSQPDEMAGLCKNSPVPIALDEELIGKHLYENKRQLIDFIRPQYLILKPGLLGGFRETTDWINIAGEFKIGWWITSALESNIGLNAIAQWTCTLDSPLHQGLGTGGLFKQNITSPLAIKNAKLFYNAHKKWEYEFVY